MHTTSKRRVRENPEYKSKWGVETRKWVRKAWIINILGEIKMAMYLCDYEK